MLQGSVGKSQAGGTGAPATGEGFLDALLTTLPPEAQGLSLQELIEWLREQGDSAGAGLALPQIVDEAAIPGGQVVESKPADVLSWIVSSRQNMADNAAVEPAGAAVVGEAEFNALLEGDEEVSLEADAPLRVPVRHPEFSQAVGERLVWMVRNESQEARIRLDPPSLGPLDISVTIKDDRATVLIHANHAVTRELLDAEAPRLRAMLGEQGFAEVDVNVARDDTRQQQAEGRAAGGARGLAAGADDVGEEQLGEVAPRVKVGVVDHYV
jgi:hypothetical protein